MISNSLINSHCFTDLRTSPPKYTLAENGVQMARSPVPPHAARPQKTPQQLGQDIQRLEKRLAQVRALDPAAVTEQFNDPILAGLTASVKEGLARTFDGDLASLRRYQMAGDFRTGPMIVGRPNPPHVVQEAVARSRLESIALLDQAIESLKEQLQELGDIEARPPDSPGPKPGSSNKVFVVHGHDDGARETVARFLERIGFEPIILHEQANRGGTVIEKIEFHGDVSFAVVLLTPDDEGCKIGEPVERRARQNVLLELGYFLGRLGRPNVCALKRGDLEIPSDFAGVVWEAMDDSGGWRLRLAKELQAAGHEIDWNTVMN
jgi:predicted nucleotide-binding protein